MLDTTGFTLCYNHIERLPNMITREELTELVQQIGDDQLEMAFERLRPLVQATKQANGAAHEEVEEQLEFIVPYRKPSRWINLPIRVIGSPPPAATMTVSEATPEETLLFQRFHDNIEWWNQHYRQIVENKSLINQFVAISQGEIFAALTYLEARAKALQSHPGDAPYIFFLHPPK
jgi:hypothetical protein